MSATSYDVVGIGNAIVDVLAHADDRFIQDHNLIKGAMTLVDQETAERLYGDMGAGTECSGGSAANTIAALASLGSAGAFIGKVCDDQLGEVFTHDIRALGIAFETPPIPVGAPTARCLILVTPDAQRTMQTYLGACVELGPDDVESDVIAGSKITYLEGYLWDPPRAKEAFILAATIAREAERTVALSLSDPFCVDRHRDDFLALLKGHVDVLFANEDEIKSLFKVETFDEAVAHVRGLCQVAALTRSAQGSVIVSDGQVHEVAAETVNAVVDSTGAGDAYAAGFLYGLTYGFSHPLCARLGGVAAAEVIGHMGARPAASLEALIKEKFG